MLLQKKSTVLLSLLAVMLIHMSSAQAQLVNTEEALQSSDLPRLAQTAERQDVQQQLERLGLDPVSAKERVSLMTDSEISQINGQLETLPAGAGLSTVDLLLIIIIILLI